MDRLRIRITLQQEKSGWRWIRQWWMTSLHGFSHKQEDTSGKKYYRCASAALMELTIKQKEIENIKLPF